MCLLSFLLECLFLFGMFATPSAFSMDELVQEKEEPVVLTSLGLVKGITMTTQDKGHFYAFRGIPYAKPPIGGLRFKNPVVADPWEDIYEATQDGPICTQTYFNQTSEDCLVLNVYSKKLPSTRNDSSSSLPVLVWIYGGGFSLGTAVSYFYNPQAIMDRDVVLVAITYRLGPFGFLSTGDSAAYGNAGMLDQVMALKWVRDNIAAFGGDPQKVALFGESAGAASAILHLLSPLSNGLFQAVIAQSGSALCPWSIQRNPLDLAIKLGRPFKCSEDNTSLLLECLRKQSAEDIMNSAVELKAYSDLYISFLPVIETPHDGAFLQEDPLKILQEGRFVNIPVISGINKDEGQMMYNYYIDGFNGTYDVVFQDKLEDVVEVILPNCRNTEKVTTAVKQEYFNGVDFKNKSATIRAAIDMLSDGYFKAANDMTVRLLAAGGATVYMYEFAYAGSASTSNLTGEIEISHADELSYLFVSMTNMTESDKRISNTLIDMWINFADQHNPTPIGSEVKWTPSSNGTIRYLRIADNLTMKENYQTNRMLLWNVEVPRIMSEDFSTSTNDANCCKSLLTQNTLFLLISALYQIHLIIRF